MNIMTNISYIFLLILALVNLPFVIEGSMISGIAFGYVLGTLITNLTRDHFS